MASDSGPRKHKIGMMKKRLPSPQEDMVTSRAWTHAVRMFSCGRLDPGLIVSHEFPLNEAATALSALRNPHSDVVKVLLKP